MRNGAKRVSRSPWRASALRRRLARLHGDERGYTMLDYVMVFAFIAVPLVFLMGKLFDVLADYFAMIAFYVSWPFI